METKSFDDIKQMFVQSAENHKRIDDLVAKTQMQLAETDQQLKETDRLVKETAKQLQKTDQQLKETDRQVKETAKQLKETDRQVKETAKQLKETDRQVKETAKQLKETDKQLKETDKHLSHKVDETCKRMDAVCDRVDIVSDKVDKVAYLYGGMANNQGAAVEAFYFNTLKDNPVLDDMQFDKVYKNLTARYRGIEDEFDIVLVNCDAVFLIEVKHKASQQDIEGLIQTKASNFPRLMTQYADYKLYLGMACFTIEQPVKDSALAQGVYILERKGDVIVSATP